MYVGKALPGTDTSASTWSIKKVTTLPDGDVVVQWADGNALFDNVWDERLSLSYS